MKLEAVHLDGALYVGIAMLTVLLAQGQQVTADRLAIWTWIDYVLFFAGILLAGGIALKTFRSESVAWHRKKVQIEDAKESGGGVTQITTKSTESVVTEVDPEISQKSEDREKKETL